MAGPTKPSTYKEDAAHYRRLQELANGKELEIAGDRYVANQRRDGASQELRNAKEALKAVDEDVLRQQEQLHALQRQNEQVRSQVVDAVTSGDAPRARELDHQLNDQQREIEKAQQRLAATQATELEARKTVQARTEEVSNLDQQLAKLDAAYSQTYDASMKFGLVASSYEDAARARAAVDAARSGDAEATHAAVAAAVEAKEKLTASTTETRAEELNRLTELRGELGVLKAERGNLQEARAQYEEELRFAEKIGDRGRADAMRAELADNAKLARGLDARVTAQTEVVQSQETSVRVWDDVLGQSRRELKQLQHLEHAPSEEVERAFSAQERRFADDAKSEEPKPGGSVDKLGKELDASADAASTAEPHSDSDDADPGASLDDLGPTTALTRDTAPDAGVADFDLINTVDLAAAPQPDPSMQTSAPVPDPTPEQPSEWEPPSSEPVPIAEPIIADPAHDPEPQGEPDLEPALESDPDLID